MRKIRILLAAAIAAVPLALVTASPAHACKQYPCPGACHLNPPVYVSEGGDVYLNNRIIECYY